MVMKFRVHCRHLSHSTLLDADITGQLCLFVLVDGRSQSCWWPVRSQSSLETSHSDEAGGAAPRAVDRGGPR
jgi:hypothetical protein